MFGSEAYIDSFYGNEVFITGEYMEAATEDLKTLGKSVWITIKNLLKKLYTALGNLLLNVNYFKNANMPEQMNKDLVQVLKISQPRTELNFKLITMWYGILSKFKATDKKLGGASFGIMYMGDNKRDVDYYGSTTLNDELDKSITEMDDALQAAQKSEAYTRLQTDKYDEKTSKPVPLNYIIPDMKKSRSGLSKFTGDLEKAENVTSGMKKVDPISSKVLTFLKKVVAYYTFRVSTLSKYFSRAKASLKAFANNVGNRDKDNTSTRTTTKNKLAMPVPIPPFKYKEVRSLYNQCKEAKTYSEYKPLYDKLCSIIHCQNQNIEGFAPTGELLVCRNKREKIPVEGRCLYHTSMYGYVLTELEPRFKTLTGVLFPEPRVYVHIGVPLDRYGAKMKTKGPDGDVESFVYKGTGTAQYVVKAKIPYVYKDPEMGRTAAYIVTDKPIPVERIR